ncbi:hypothetical protein D3C84_761940 [compost metagenome]
MLPGDHQQVHGAGVLQHLPILATQPTAVAQDQRRQHTGAAVGIDLCQRLAHLVAPGAPGRLQETTVLDRTGRADTSAQQPGGIVEAVWVQQPGGPFELHRQSPAFTAVDGRATEPGEAQRCR